MAVNTRGRACDLVVVSAALYACMVLAAGIRPAVLGQGVSMRADTRDGNALPVVLWHGMGDSCCNKYSIGSVKKLIEDRLGVFVYSIATGAGETADVYSSYFGNVNEQVNKVCAELRNVPELQGGFNAVGFSQGGQFLRAVVERCQHIGPKMATLVTMGSQHQGVMNIPGCDGSVQPNKTAGMTLSQDVNDACSMMQSMLGRGAYLPFVRDHVVQAQYFKDPNRLEEYLRSNVFLPDVNNEHNDKNGQYRDNLASLERLVLVRFAQDATVVPRDSAWFSFFDGKQLLPLQQQDLYTQDWLGLKALDEAGRIAFDEAPGGHMQFTLQWFDDNVVQKYLAPQVEGGPQQLAQ